WSPTLGDTVGGTLFRGEGRELLLSGIGGGYPALAGKGEGEIPPPPAESGIPPGPSAAESRISHGGAPTAGPLEGEILLSALGGGWWAGLGRGGPGGYCFPMSERMAARRTAPSSRWVIVPSAASGWRTSPTCRTNAPWLAYSPSAAIRSLRQPSAVSTFSTPESIPPMTTVSRGSEQSPGSGSSASTTVKVTVPSAVLPAASVAR